MHNPFAVTNANVREGASVIDVYENAHAAIALPGLKLVVLLMMNDRGTSPELVGRSRIFHRNEFWYPLGLNITIDSSGLPGTALCASKHCHNAGATDPNIACETNASALDLPLLRAPTQLVDYLETLSKACRSERMALRNEPPEGSVTTRPP